MGGGGSPLYLVLPGGMCGFWVGQLYLLKMANLSAVCITPLQPLLLRIRMWRRPTGW